eukprot:Skav211006  [mRNA]  locus=scaffold1610:310253:311077:+ [translate_table: standard]
MSYSLPVANCILQVEEQTGVFRKVCSLLTTAALLLWPVICFSPLVFLGLQIQTIFACGPWVRGCVLASIYLRPSPETTWPTRSCFIHVFWDVPLLLVSYVVDVVLHPFGTATFFHSGHHGPRATEFASEISGTPFYLGCRPLKHHVKMLKDLGVGLVVNMTKEWPGPQTQYETQGITQIQFKTLDTEPPTLQVLQKGAKEVASWCREHKDKKVYIHCKGGRSRSSCMLVACMVEMKLCSSPSEAVERIQRDRPVVDKGILTYGSLQDFVQIQGK